MYWIQCQIQMEVCNINVCDLFEVKIQEYSSENIIEGIEAITDDNDQIHYLISPTISEFMRATKSYVHFHLFFMFLFTLEASLLVTFFSIFVISSLLALMLSGIFLTLFVYFMLKIYFLGKKSEHLYIIRDQYVKKCKEFLSYKEGFPESHITLANACNKLATALQGVEHQYYKPINLLNSFSHHFEKYTSHRPNI